MSKFSTTNALRVHRHFGDGRSVAVGSLQMRERDILFRYDSDYRAQHQNLSPLQLEFDDSLQQAPTEPHAGLHGVWADSLPDGWGLKLMHKTLLERDILPQQLTALDRLAFVGDRGTGALSYEPIAEYAPSLDGSAVSIADLGDEAVTLYEGETEQVLQELVQAGSSGGARPKAQLYLAQDDNTRARVAPRDGYSPWLVKFTSSLLPLGHEEGLCEAAYLTMAERAGLQVSQWQLLPAANRAPGWLALRRFDRTEQGRLHTHSLAGLLHADFRTPSTDYEHLLRVCMILCGPAAAQEAFAHAMFNLFAINQDDHSKNFSLLLHDDDRWRPAPCYDLTFSPNAHGEHSTSFVGYGKAPPLAAVQRLANLASFRTWNQAKHRILQIVEALSEWNSIATDLGVSDAVKKQVARLLEATRKQNRQLLQ